MSTRHLVLVLAALVPAACSDDGAAAGAPGAAAPVHAGAAVAPGSHDDWCGEHAVPESQCTLCDPGLAAAFKATNDWCAEHGLPESQCRACNPGLVINRPPKDGP